MTFPAAEHLGPVRFTPKVPNMQDAQPPEPPPTRESHPRIPERAWKASHSSALKVVVLGATAVVLALPLAMVSSLVAEREGRRSSVEHEISTGWGSAQRLTGPTLQAVYVCAEEKCKVARRQVELLPERAVWQGVLEPELRSRGLFETVVWQADLGLEAELALPAPFLVRGSDNYRLARVDVLIGVSDLIGVQDGTNLAASRGDDAPIELALEPSGGRPFDGTSLRARLPAALWASRPENDAVVAASENPLSLHLQLELRGTRSLRLAPVALETRIDLASSWPSPSFQGA